MIVITIVITIIIIIIIIVFIVFITRNFGVITDLKVR